MQAIIRRYIFPAAACLFLFGRFGIYAQSPNSSWRLKLLGTRSWIKISWPGPLSGNAGFNIYWSTENRKPAAPSAIASADRTAYYIKEVKAATLYFVWVAAFNTSGETRMIKDSVTTRKNWSLDPDETKQLDSPGTEAVPSGMQLFWHDEFNDSLLDRNKWFTDYYSTLDFLRSVKSEALRENRLPQAAYKLNGHTIDLFVNDTLPVEDFENGKKISSIQTYDWSTNENLLDNRRGGYFEARVRRTFTGKPEGLNTAFWFDSPGPDLKYYLQEGSEVHGTKGIRPKGQLFEIDIFENLNAQFVMHGHVDSNGRFIHNLATDIAYGFQHKDQWVTHGILWTPTSIKHYINGKLIKAYDNKHVIFSPDHFMNIFLGSYGKGGSVSMEVDYIRGYQWPISASNELPNGGFELNTTLLPWEGTGRLSENAKRTGKYGLLLKPGDSIEQYVYLNNNRDYLLTCYARGKSILRTEAYNVKAVTGELSAAAERSDTCNEGFSQTTIHFKTGKMPENNLKTICIAFFNNGNSDILLDDIVLRQQHGNQDSQ